jgi:repressor LexA
VQAGEPILAVENIEGYINLDRNLVSSGDVFLLRVQGDSMIDAHIQDGDFALVKPQPNAENGEIVVALIEDEATIKRIFKKRDLIRLEPAHPKMEPIVVKKGEKKVAKDGSRYSPHRYGCIFYFSGAEGQSFAPGKTCSGLWLSFSKCGDFGHL